MSAYATTGLQSLGKLPWGSHVCQFFSDASDLRDTLVPYFKAGTMLVGRDGAVQR
jgi:hypothetical protein